MRDGGAEHSKDVKDEHMFSPGCESLDVTKWKYNSINTQISQWCSVLDEIRSILIEPPQAIGTC